jgi:hypothetical protein
MTLAVVYLNVDAACLRKTNVLSELSLAIA